jgi:hypothetical protein
MIGRQENFHDKITKTAKAWLGRNEAVFRAIEAADQRRADRNSDFSLLIFLRTPAPRGVCLLIGAVAL